MKRGFFNKFSNKYSEVRIRSIRKLRKALKVMGFLYPIQTKALYMYKYDNKTVKSLSSITKRIINSQISKNFYFYTAEPIVDITKTPTSMNNHKYNHIIDLNTIKMVGIRTNELKSSESYNKGIIVNIDNYQYVEKVETESLYLRTSKLDNYLYRKMVRNI